MARWKLRGLHVGHIAMGQRLHRRKFIFFVVFSVSCVLCASDSVHFAGRVEYIFGAHTKWSSTESQENAKQKVERASIYNINVGGHCHCVSYCGNTISYNYKSACLIVAVLQFFGLPFSQFRNFIYQFFPDIIVSH